MRKIKGYHVVLGRDTEIGKFNEVIDGYLAKGWTLRGELKVNTESTDDEIITYLYQVIVEYEQLTTIDNANTRAIKV